MRHTGYIESRDLSATERADRRRPSSTRLRILVFVAAAGVLMGLQIFKPNKRVIEALIGLVLVFILWSASGFYALLFFVLAYPFPFALSFGNSDFIFVLLIFIMSLVRTQAGYIKLQTAGLLNIPILLMVGSYVLSFYNVDYAAGEFGVNLVAVYPFFTAIMFFYLMISYVDGEKRLRTTLNVMLVSASFVILFTLFELLFPGKVLIPNWLYTSRREAMLVVKGLRMTGPFRDFELVAEFFALMAPLIFLCLIRSRTLSARVAYAALLLADLFMMFTTTTRGAFISLSIGLIYMAIISRRDLNFVRVTAILATLAFLFVCFDAFIARYTTSGSLFERLVATTFKSGFIPENRYVTWKFGITQGLNHPFIGYGPAWNYAKGLEAKFLPHSIYLYLFNITGLFGLSAFLFFVYRLVRMSAASVRSSLVHSPFPEALLKVLHVCLIMFIVDQIKIEYLRNSIYIYFIWLMFGLMAATYKIMQKNARERSLSVPSP